MRLFIVSYDIADERRRRHVAELMEGFGRRLQYSVFECMLGEVGLARLKVLLDPLINHDEDQVLFIDIGPLDGRARDAVSALGKPYESPQPGSVVI
jgi:CRISPR-associated protein Cas2